MATEENQPRASSFDDPASVVPQPDVEDDMKAKLDALFAQVAEMQKHYGVPPIRGPEANSSVLNGSPSTSNSEANKRKVGEGENDGTVEKKQKVDEEELETVVAGEEDGGRPEQEPHGLDASEVAVDNEGKPLQEGEKEGRIGRKEKRLRDVEPKLLQRGVWDWDRTEALLQSCVEFGIKGIEPVQKAEDKTSYSLDDLVDNNLAIQWIRRMECGKQRTSLPMRGPFPGKIPIQRRIADNPLKLSAMPLGCDLKLSPDDYPKAEEKPYRLGYVPSSLQSSDALKVWEERSIDLRQFEALSLQFERIAALQTLQTKELESLLRKKLHEGSPEVKAAMVEVHDRVKSMRNLNDLALNRAALFAYSAFKASKCIYLEAAGVPPDQWGNLVGRKWKSDRLFDGKETVQGSVVDKKAPVMARAAHYSPVESTRAASGQQLNYRQGDSNRQPVLFSDVASGYASTSAASGSIPGPSGGGYQPSSRASNNRGKRPGAKKQGVKAVPGDRLAKNPRQRMRKARGGGAGRGGSNSHRSASSSYGHGSALSVQPWASSGSSSYNYGGGSESSMQQYRASDVSDMVQRHPSSSISQMTSNFLQTPYAGAHSGQSLAGGSGVVPEDTIAIMNRIEGLLSRAVGGSRSYADPL